MKSKNMKVAIKKITEAIRPLSASETEEVIKTLYFLTLSAKTLATIDTLAEMNSMRKTKQKNKKGKR